MAVRTFPETERELKRVGLEMSRQAEDVKNLRDRIATAGGAFIANPFSITGEGTGDATGVITAGAGLSGGGTLPGAVTLSVNQSYAFNWSGVHNHSANITLNSGIAVDGVDISAHAHAGGASAPQLDWDTVWSDAVHDHSASGEGGTTIAATSFTGVAAVSSSWTWGTNNRIYFRNADTSIYSNTTGEMIVGATVELDLTSPIVNVSGDISLGNLHWIGIADNEPHIVFNWSMRPQIIIALADLRIYDGDRFGMHGAGDAVNFEVNGASGFVLIKGRVGIATDSIDILDPGTAQLQVGDEITTGQTPVITNDVMLSVNAVLSNATGNEYANVTVIEQDTATAGSAFAVYGYGVTSHASGTVVGMSGAAFVSENTAAGTVTGATGIHVGVYESAGTITTGYGIYMSAIEGTTSWSLYSSDPDADMYHAGQAVIGSSTIHANVGLEVALGSEQLRLAYASDLNKYVSFKVGVNGDLQLEATTSITLDPGDSQVLPGGQIVDDLGTYNRMWRTLYVAEIYAETLVAQDVMATIGGRILVAPTTYLTSSLSGINPVLNWQFSTLGGGGADVFENWVEGTGGAIWASGANVRSEPYCCYLQFDVTQCDIHTDNITVAASTTYSFVFWHRGDICYYGVYDVTNSSWLISSTATNDDGQTYHPYRSNFTTAANTAAVQLWFWGTTVPGVALVEDVELLVGEIETEHNNLAVNDYTRSQAAPGGVPQIEVMQIVAGPAGSGPYTYQVFRSLDGTPVNAWQPGDAVVNIGGVVGEGYIDLTSTQTVHNHLGPSITMYTRSGTTNWNDVQPVITMGNLDSFLGYGTEFGVIIGDDLEAATADFSGLTADRTNGLRMFNTDISLYRLGTETVRLNSSVPSFAMGPTLPVGPTTNDGIWMGYHAGEAAWMFRVGDVTSIRYFIFDGYDFRLYDSEFNFMKLDGGGIEIVADGTLYFRVTDTPEVYVGAVANEHILITTTGISIRDATTVTASWIGTTITLGPTATEHVIINSASMSFKDGSTVMGSLTNEAWVLGRTDGTEANVEITAGGVINLRKGTTDYLTLDVTPKITIGLVTDAYVTAGPTGIKFYDDTADIAVSLSSDRRLRFYDSAQNETGYIKGLISGDAIFLNANGLSMVGRHATASRGVEILAFTETSGASGFYAASGSVDFALLTCLGTTNLSVDDGYVEVSGASGTYLRTVEDIRCGGALMIGANEDPAVDLVIKNGDAPRIRLWDYTATTATLCQTFIELGYASTWNRAGYIGYASGSNDILYIDNEGGNQVLINASGLDVFTSRSTSAELTTGIFILQDSCRIYSAGEGWGYSSAWLWGAYPIPYGSRGAGDLWLTGNTKHAQNGNIYGLRPGSVGFTMNGGVFNVRIGTPKADGTGIDTDVVWNVVMDANLNILRATGGVRPGTGTADPTTEVEDGMLFYRTDTDKLRLRANGAWVDLN